GNDRTLCARFSIYPTPLGEFAADLVRQGLVGLSPGGYLHRDPDPRKAHVDWLKVHEISITPTPALSVACILAVTEPDRYTPDHRIATAPGLGAAAMPGTKDYAGLTSQLVRTCKDYAPTPLVEKTQGSILDFRAVVTTKDRDRDGDILHPEGAWI